MGEILVMHSTFTLDRGTSSSQATPVLSPQPFRQDWLPSKETLGQRFARKSFMFLNLIPVAVCRQQDWEKEKLNSGGVAVEPSAHLTGSSGVWWPFSIVPNWGQIGASLLTT